MVVLPSGELLVLHLLTHTGSADKTVILAALAGKFTVTLSWVSDILRDCVSLISVGAYLGLLHSTPFTGLPDSLVAAIHTTSVAGMVMLMRRAGTGTRTLRNTMDRLGRFGASGCVLSGEGCLCILRRGRR